jgi:hypothetical protein
MAPTQENQSTGQKSNGCSTTDKPTLASNICAYADYLENEGCEFVLTAFDKNTDKGLALHSKNGIVMLAAMFKKSDEVYEMFKTAEAMAGLDDCTSLN